MKNDIKTRIDKFIKKYPEPYQFKVTLEWKRKDGLHSKTYFKNNQSGQNRYWNRNDCGFVTTTGRDFIVQHYRYDEKLGLLELAYAVFDCHTPKEGENRRWKYGYRYFIPKDTRELYDVNGNTGNYLYMRTTYTSKTTYRYYFAQHFAAMPCVSKQFEDEFLSFAGNNLQTSLSWKSHITKGCYPWLLQYWFSYQPKTRTTGKVQKLIDELTSKELELTDDIKVSIQNKMNNDDAYYGKKWAWFDLGNKVFRCFVESKDDIFEDKRVYITDKQCIVTTINPQGEWVTNRSFTNNYFNFKIVNPDSVYKMPYCDYLKSVTDNNSTVYRIISIMRHPEIEQLVNMGLCNIAKKLSKSDHIDIIAKELFGEPNQKKNILAKYGLNKKQAEYVDNRMLEEKYIYGWSNYEHRGIAMIKQFMQINNVASLDDDTFHKYYNFVCNLDWSGKRSLESLPKDVRQKVVTKLCNMYDKHNNVITLFSDMVSAYNYINRENRPNVDVYDIKSYEELVRLHDTCIELQRLEQEERQRLYNMAEAERHAILEKKMAKLDEERSKFNYSDADFTIRLPERLSEIVNEGSSLRHCVGGYTQNHAEGRTTIMFLRKNDDPTTSFYTIEIRNDNSIQQIHGFGNKWLGNDPEAIPTVMRWLRENNLHCTDEILLSTAKGYCSGNAPLVEKPII